MRVIEILSHELRSPITTIHLGTKVLREQGHRISQPVRIEVVEAVEEEAERLYRLVEDLLAVARHEGGAAPLPVGPIALQHWLAPVIAAEVQCLPHACASGSSIPPDLPPVIADDAALAQVVRNLLANVTRYAPDGMPAEIVAWPHDDGTVRLEVLDRGPGVEADEADHLVRAVLPLVGGRRARVRGRARARRGPAADAGDARHDRGAAADRGWRAVRADAAGRGRRSRSRRRRPAGAARRRVPTPTPTPAAT